MSGDTGGPLAGSSGGNGGSWQNAQGNSSSLHPQIQHILSLPPTLLAQIARADDPKEQLQLASNAGSQAQAALSHMAQSPPAPSAPPSNSFVSDALPFLLHTKFSPHTLGISAVAGLSDAQRNVFEPTYASVDLWAQEQAQLLASNATVEHAELAQVAEQLKAWSHSREEREVDTTITQARQIAVDKASQAAFHRKSLHDQQRQVAMPNLPPDAYSSIDISAYKQYYLQELDRQASGYYPTLHHKALQELEAQKNLAPQTKLVRASAVAALAANVLAANDMASAAEYSLSTMGLSSGSQQTASLNQHDPSTYYDLGSASAAFAATPLPGAVDQRIVAMVQEAEVGGGCTPQARDHLLHFAHNAYSTNTPMDLLPLLHMLDRLHPHHCPTLLLLSCVYYSRGSTRSHELKAKGLAVEQDPIVIHNFEASLMMNHKILEIDSEYVSLSAAPLTTILY